MWRAFAGCAIIRSVATRWHAQRILSGVLVVLSWAGCLLAAYLLGCWHYGGYRPDTSGYGRAFPPGLRLPGPLRRDIGWLKNQQMNFFLRLPEAKRPGTQRVGIFGGSEVAGAELGRDESFPSLLQEDLQRSGLPRAEVLNFGSKGYRIHQAYMLWRLFGRSRGLDVVVLSIEDCQPPRDTTFLAPWRIEEPGSLELHSRFIIDARGLRLISLPGGSPERAASRYWALFPPWTEARYSRDTPLFLRRLLPRGRRLRTNPFYYDCGGTEQEEAFRTYRAILRDMAGSTERLVVDLVGTDEFAAAFRTRCLAGLPDNVVCFRGSREAEERTAPPLRKLPQGHFSAILHRQKAVELAGFLTGKDRVALRAYTLEPDDGPPPAPLPQDLSLRDFPAVSIGTAERVVADFYPIPFDRTLPFDPSARMAKPFDFARGGYEALVMLDQPDHSCYPLRGRLRAGAPVLLVLKAGRREVPVQIGVVRSLAPGLGRAEIWKRAHEGTLPGGGAFRLELSPDASGLTLTADKPMRLAALRIGAEPAGELRLVPAGPSRYVARDLADPRTALGFHLVAGCLRYLEEAGSAPLRLFLRLEKADGWVLLQPLLRAQAAPLRRTLPVPPRPILSTRRPPCR